MNFNPQCKIIYNYDRIIHNIEKNYAKRQDIGQTKWKDAFSLKIKNCAIR